MADTPASQACNGCLNGHQTTYAYQTLDVPGSSQTIFWGINDFGELAGQFEINGATAHAMAYRRGHFETLDPKGPLGAGFSAAGGPTDSGTTFGGYADATGVQHGFVLQGSHLKVVDFPGHLNANVDGMNEFGAIAAVYWDADGAFHGVLRRGSGFDVNIDVPGAHDTYPLGINASGDVVGYWDAGTAATHGFYRSANGKITTVDIPNATATVLFAVNDVGQTAGYYADASGAIHGFVEQNGKVQTLDMPGALATIATAINNFGVVAGETVDAKGQRHGMIATPHH